MANVKDRLIYNSVAYDNDELYGGVSYERNLNPETDLQIGAVCAASIKFKMKSNPFNLGDELVYYIVRTGGYTKVGHFFVTDIEKGKTDYTYTAYDAISKLDADCTAWKQSLVLPMTLKQVFASLCTYLSIPYDPSSFVNSAITFDTNYLDDGISYRQVVQFITQLAAGICYMEGDTMTIKSFDSTVVKSFTSANYKTLEVADYVCPVIDKVWYGREDGDIGYSSGSGTNTLKIYTNPFLVEDAEHTAADIQTALDNIYNVVSTYTYRPFKLTTFLQEWFEYKAKYISINGETAPIFNISWGPSGITMETTGNPDRTYVQPVSLAEQRMNGKYNTLRVDIDKAEREIGDVSGAVSSLSQTVDGVRLDLTYMIEDVADDLNDHAVLQSQFIRYGPSGLELGKEGDPISALLTNSELAFFNGSIKATYLNTDVLNISKVWIVGPQQDNRNAQLFIGEFQFIRKEDGSLALKVGS